MMTVYFSANLPATLCHILHLISFPHVYTTSLASGRGIPKEGRTDPFGDIHEEGVKAPHPLFALHVFLPTDSGGRM
jgi:hypothetical protein